jgi:hypothetical protein
LPDRRRRGFAAAHAGAKTTMKTSTRRRKALAIAET